MKNKGVSHDRHHSIGNRHSGTKEKAESDKPKLLFRLSRNVTYIGPVKGTK